MKNKLFASILLMSVVLCIVNTAVAQNTTFKLSEYKNPNYLYQSLDLNFGLDGGLNGSKNNSLNDYSSNAFSLNSLGGAVYTRYVNSPTAQGEMHISFNAEIGSSNNNAANTNSNNTLENKRKSFSHAEVLSLNGIHRFYNQKQNYIELNGQLYLFSRGYSYSNDFYSSGNATSSEESNYQVFANTIVGSFLVGKGRIEQVQDARMALYILDDLFKLHREKRTITDEDVNKLAELITTLKYTRYYDTRLMNIANIIAIDSLLQKNGIVSNPDAVYFTSLNDNWEYANNPIRFSGHRLFTGLSGNFGYTHMNESGENHIPDNLTNERTIEQKEPGLFLVLGYSYEKPTSLKWQNSANIRASIGISRHYENLTVRQDPNPETETSLYQETSPAVNLSAEYGFGYYPNSRTWMQFVWYLQSSWDKNMEGTTNADKEHSLNDLSMYTGPQLNAYYYLSPKLRLSFYYHGYFNFDNTTHIYGFPEGSPEKETTNQWSQSVSAVLTYSLF
jgi:hypothetical protein